MLPLNLKGRHVVVTSGPTYEPIDPVRFLGNRSSGKQGHAIAAAFADLGARVTLVTGPVKIPDPFGVSVVHVKTAQQMLDAVLESLPADVAICAAAVSDWRAKDIADKKIKKKGGPEEELTLTFVRNPDILGTLGSLPPPSNSPLPPEGGGMGGRENAPVRPQIVVGFAAETHDVVVYARDKLERKHADLILANNVDGGAVFGSDLTHLIAVSRTGVDDWSGLNKQQAAQRIVAAVSGLLG